MVGGLPILPSGEPDLLSLWLVLYPGDMTSRIAAMNTYDLRENVRWIAIAENEYVRFWCLILGARQFSEKMKNMWSDTDEPLCLRPSPKYEHHVAAWWFSHIRRLLRDIFPVSSADSW